MTLPPPAPLSPDRVRGLLDACASNGKRSNVAGEEWTDLAALCQAWLDSQAALTTPVGVTEDEREALEQGADCLEADGFERDPEVKAVSDRQAATLRSLCARLTSTATNADKAAPSAQDQWQPIATAPRDVLLLFRGVNGFYALGFWDGVMYRNQDQGSLRIEPSQWMKIPGGRYDLFAPYTAPSGDL